MKLSVFTVATPDLTPEELANAAAAAGIDGIEWRYKEVPAHFANEQLSFWSHNICSIDPSASDQEIERFRLAAVEHQLVNLCVTPYLTCGDVTGTERVMQVAKKVGARFIRVALPGYDGSRNYHDLFAEEVDYLHHVQELSQQYGVKGLVEIHHRTIAPSAGLVYKLVSALLELHWRFA